MKAKKPTRKATDILLKGLKIGQDNKLLEVQRNAYEYLSSVEEKKGNYNQSLAYFKKYIAFKEQIFNSRKGKGSN